jgi:hypothetical protein
MPGCFVVPATIACSLNWIFCQPIYHEQSILLNICAFPTNSLFSIVTLLEPLTCRPPRAHVCLKGPIKIHKFTHYFFSLFQHFFEIHFQGASKTTFSIISNYEQTL